MKRMATCSLPIHSQNAEKTAVAMREARSCSSRGRSREATVARSPPKLMRHSPVHSAPSREETPFTGLDRRWRATRSGRGRRWTGSGTARPTLRAAPRKHLGSVDEVSRKCLNPPSEQRPVDSRPQLAVARRCDPAELVQRPVACTNRQSLRNTCRPSASCAQRPAAVVERREGAAERRAEPDPSVEGAWSRSYCL